MSTPTEILSLTDGIESTPPNSSLSPHTDNTLSPSLKRKPTVITFANHTDISSNTTLSIKIPHSISSERVLVHSECEEPNRSFLAQLNPLRDKRPKLQHCLSSPHLASPHLTSKPPLPVPAQDRLKEQSTIKRKKSRPFRKETGSPPSTPRSQMDVDAAIIAPVPELPPSGADLGHLPELSAASAQSASALTATTLSSPRMNPRTSTPRPAPGDSPQGTTKSSPPEAGRALNVTDALSYLDAVKVQFQDKPEVYNRFLDIMKDFKGQVIDTPGVISRVSRLFHGNPVLIQGFNTFLPVGYRIDISDPADPNTITVTTPQGTTTQNTFMANNLSRSHVGTPTFPGAIPVIPAHVAGPSSRSHTPHVFNLHGPQPPFDPSFSPGFQNPQTTAAASVLGNMGSTNKGPVEAQPAGEFNHAIHYLNKIKARYSDDANTYKQFLDILQTYQKEQRHLQDPAFQSQVYVQVQLLFKEAPDLLAEFKDFLPDAVASGQNQGPAILPQPVGVPAPSSAAWTAPETQSSSPAERVVKKVAVPSKRKKRGAEKESTPVPPAKPAPSRAKKVKHHHNQDSASTSFSPLVQPKSPQATPLHTHVVPPPIQPSPLPNSHGLQSSSSTLSVAASTDNKLLFFDRAKKSLESREMYEDFLKLLSLFSKEIIEAKTLIERANVFLGDELLTEFKDLIGWDERQDDVENGPPGSIRTGPPEALSALPADDGEGPSYRRLPDSEIRLACSGRDELCRSVLNDEWVSHPTWASEEAGFISHKKNSFEEALHKSEEERFEYHVHLEGLARTIAVLEPLNSRIEEMSNDERSLFKLKPDLGGPSKTIYHRIIKKVYGRDSGLEVIQALQDCPSVAVPVVLARLRQRDEEWRRSQREWSRTWREVDSKNFYKSLDHQGISFKANDKKNITSKYFVADVESIKNQQLETWDFEGVASFARGSVGHQLEYSFNDTPALLDSLKMVYSFLDRSQVNYSAQERRAVEKFLRAFIPALCKYPVAEFNAACLPLEAVHDDDPSDLNGVDGTRSGRRSAGSAHSVQTGGVAAGDLRRKLLRTVQEKAAGKLTPSASRDPSPSPEHRSPNLSRNGDAPDGQEDIWVTEVGADAFSQSTSSRVEAERPFFVNTTFYTLVRLLQLLYSRILMCKEIGAQHAAENHASLLANRVAVELGLDEPNGPSTVLEQTIEVLGDRGASDKANVVYMYLLNACEKMFDGDMDQATFEEHMRWFFGNKAYQLFTLDKLITALVKQVQTVLSDNRCQELWKLCKSTQNAEIHTTQDVIRYRREAERHVGQDDHLYRLQWIPELKCVRVYLVGPEDPSMECDGTAVSRWRGYIDSYVMNHPTEWGVKSQQGSPVFLRRCTRGEEGTAFVRHMRIRVGLPSYKLVYESGTEDVAWRMREPVEEQKLLQQAHVREEERRKSPSDSEVEFTCLALTWSLIMAKPISPDRAGCSTSSTWSRYNTTTTTTTPRRRRQAPSRAPSSAVLALLSTISASVTSVHGSPAPLSFLCPSFIPEPTPTLDLSPRGKSLLSRREQWAKNLGSIKHVPDKFERGDNGRWRRVDTYTLYGSTTCKDDATSSATALDDQKQSSASSSVPITTTSSTATYNISLPPGWKPPGNSSSSRTTLILALSLVLAFAICFLIIGCLFWRKSKRRKRRHNADIEARKRRRQNTDEDDRVSMLVEKEVKVKQKIWAKATARWKANAKYTARQRRGKRIVTISRVNSPRNSCASLGGMEETQTGPAQTTSAPSSPTFSRRSSMESMYAVTRTSLSEVVAPSEKDTRGDASLKAPLSSPPPSPPAYHHSSGAQESTSTHGGNRLPFSVNGSRPSRPSRSDAEPSSSYDAPSQSNSASVSVHAAHVATDDKTVLARMADLASAPPLDAADSSQSTAEYHISAPLWQDEEFEDFRDESHQPAKRNLSPPQPSSAPASPAHLFPSPPSKGKMAAPDFYDYPYTFDDILVEPDPGPSAPPFEEEPQHTLNLAGMVPSAPSLPEAESAYHGDTYPSAPPHDWAALPSQASSADIQTIHPPHHDTIPSPDDTTSDSRWPTSSTDGSDSLVQGPVASDGTLPCYYP
ncbi:hypothetical protein DXG01_009748 [Tephrocybe rancida]|nr:hypothetical protein DXG01_009748 [Tephrocybe rancida]